MSTGGSSSDIDADRAFRWRFARSLSRVEPVVDSLLSEYATSYWLRPVRRHEVARTDGAGVRWLIGREPVVDLIFERRGPLRLLVHDIALVRPLTRRLRSRHVRIEYEAATSQ